MLQERVIEATRTRDRPKAFALGRVCEEPGCETRLSRYNPEAVCGVHSETERGTDH